MEQSMAKELIELMETVITPVKDSLSELKTDVKDVAKDIQEMKTSDSLQEKDIAALREKVKAQQDKTVQLESQISDLELRFTKQINELVNASTRKKAARWDSIAEQIWKFAISVAITALLAYLGLDKLVK